MSRYLRESVRVGQLSPGFPYKPAQRCCYLPIEANGGWVVRDVVFADMVSEYVGVC